jgi:hypothetical protein
MDEFGARLPARHGHIPNRQSIHLVRSLRLILGDIDHIVGRGIQYELGAVRSDGALYRRRIGDIDATPVIGEDGVAPGRKLALDFKAKLASTTEKDRFSAHIALEL